MTVFAVIADLDVRAMMSDLTDLLRMKGEHVDVNSPITMPLGASGGRALPLHWDKSSGLIPHRNRLVGDPQV